jgi:hypothetical protein
MYETRGAIRYLAKDKKQMAAAEEFFKAIEKVGGGARYKKADVCNAGIAESKAALDAFVKTL